MTIRSASPMPSLRQDTAAAAVEIPADGSYTCAVTLEGGSGRATVESPAALTVADGIIDRDHRLEQPEL